MLTEASVLPSWPAVLVCRGPVSPELHNVNDLISESPDYLNPSACNCFVFFSLLPWKADDTYLQLKKDLEYLDLKVGGGAGEIA